MKPKIIYYGTPEFACAGFEALLDEGYEILAVVTAPDKPAGRGLKPKASDLKQAALNRGVPVLQPVKLKSPEFIATLEALQPDLQVIVAFRKLPQVVWALPKLGTFNLHASLLPAYRGAAPINWAIINGETQTGVTTFFLNEDIDMGMIIDQKSCEIYPHDNAESLYQRLMHLGAELIVQTVRSIENQTVRPKPQPQIQISLAPKIFKNDCLIRLDQTSKKIYDFIRGLSPYPAAWINFYGKTLKVFSSKISEKNPTNPVQEPFFSDGKTFLAAHTLDGAIEFTELQLEGRKKMGVEEFLRGFKWENRDQNFS
jgi:methionyl-tRNA formyltransferase